MGINTRLEKATDQTGADPDAATAAPAALTGAAVGDTVSTTAGWGSSTEAGFDSMHVAIDANVADIAAQKVELDKLITDVASLRTQLTAGIADLTSIYATLNAGE